MKKEKIKIKVCGIRKEEEIQLLNKYPVSYIGFIFAKSKRQLTLEQGKVLRKLVRDDIEVVGVFMNNELGFIKEAIRICDLDIVQLHGEETDEIIQKINIPVWKSIAVKDKASLYNINMYPSSEGILLDTYHKGMTGGTGHSFDWSYLKAIDRKKKLILAGGLSPENIVKAWQEVKPDILDVNSGLEENNQKDSDKIALLFKRIKEIENE